MLTTSKLKVGESQFHYNQRTSEPLISIDVTMLKVEKVSVDVLRKHWKWRTDVMERISMPRRAYEMLKEELEKCRNQIRTFEKNYMEKMDG